MARITEWRRDDNSRLWKDDPSIADTEVLLRRVPQAQLHWDKSTNRYRPASLAFGNGTDGETMSVYLRSEMDKLGYPPERTLEDQEDGFGVAGILAEVVRDASQVIERDPNPDPPFHVCDPAHAVVAGTKAGKKRSKVGAKFYWVVPPPNVDGPPPDRPSAA